MGAELTEAGLNRPELHRRDLRFRCFRRSGELPVDAGGQGSQVQGLSSRRHDGRCTSSEVRRLLSCLSCKDWIRGRSCAAALVIFS